MTNTTEIFAHGVFVTEDPEAEGIYIVQGKDWENQPFSLYLNSEEAAALLVQLGFLSI